MYFGHTIPTEWPKRADGATYEKYAKLPSWHVEEAASLVAGFEPRADVYFFPLDGKPGTADQPDTAPPYAGAVTWGVLMSPNGPIDKILSLYARYKRIPDWNFRDDMLYVLPGEFLAFCGEHGVPVPPDLTKALSNRSAVAPANERSAAPKQSESRYREHTARVASELVTHGARVTVSQLKELVESEFEPTVRTVVSRSFQGYVEKWRRDSLGNLLAQVLRPEAGRPSEDEESYLKKHLPEKLARVLWPARQPPKKLRK